LPIWNRSGDASDLVGFDEDAWDLVDFGVVLLEEQPINKAANKKISNRLHFLIKKYFRNDFESE